MTLAKLWAHLTRWPVACALLALVQSGAVAWLAFDRISILRSETEIVLNPAPVDPRDLLRGDYVILSYNIRVPPQTDANEAPRRPLADGPDVWVRIEQSDLGDWRAVELADRPPEGPSTTAAKSRWLRARADGYRDGRGDDQGDDLVVTNLRYGLERYYVPEGEGRKLEKLIGDRRLQVLVAIADDGRAAIKGLRIDGETAYEEPWF